MQTIKIPETLKDEEQTEWLRKAFTKIVEACKIHKIKELEVEVDYGGEVTISKGVKVPCTKKWTLKEIKKWLKQ